LLVSHALLLVRPRAGLADGAELQLGERLPISLLSAVARLGLVLEDDHLVARPVPQDQRFDRGTADEGLSHQRLIAAPEQEDGVQAHRLADLLRDAIDHDPITLGHPELLSTGGNDGKHAGGAPGRNTVVYHAICSGPWSTCAS